MRKIDWWLALGVALLCIPSWFTVTPASAGVGSKEIVAAPLTDQAINTACVSDPGNDDTPSCASFELYTPNASKVCLIIRYTFGAASAVQLYKDSSVDGDVPWGILQLGDASTPPTVSMGAHKVEWSTSANDTWTTCFDVDSPYTRFRLTSTGGTSGDTVSVKAILLGG